MIRIFSKIYENESLFCQCVRPLRPPFNCNMFDQGPIGDKRGRVRIDCYDDPLYPMNGINSPKGCSAESMTLNTITGGGCWLAGLLG